MWRKPLATDEGSLLRRRFDGENIWPKAKPGPQGRANEAITRCLSKNSAPYIQPNVFSIKAPAEEAGMRE